MDDGASYEAPRRLPFHLWLSVICLLLLWSIWSYLSSPLRGYPGPFLASKEAISLVELHSIANSSAGWTNLWRLYHISRGSFHEVLVALHKQYGPAVRIGPNVLDLDSPGAIKTVFNTKTDWQKVVPPSRLVNSSLHL
jgi:hypothetical protein